MIAKIVCKLKENSKSIKNQLEKHNKIMLKHLVDLLK